MKVVSFKKSLCLTVSVLTLLSTPSHAGWEDFDWWAGLPKAFKHKVVKCTPVEDLGPLANTCRANNNLVNDNWAFIKHYRIPVQPGVTIPQVLKAKETLLKFRLEQERVNEATTNLATINADIEAKAQAIVDAKGNKDKALAEDLEAEKNKLVDRSYKLQAQLNAHNDTAAALLEEATGLHDFRAVQIKYDMLKAKEQADDPATTNAVRDFINELADNGNLKALQLKRDAYIYSRDGFQAEEQERNATVKAINDQLVEAGSIEAKEFKRNQIAAVFNDTGEYNDPNDAAVWKQLTEELALKVPTAYIDKLRGLLLGQSGYNTDIAAAKQLLQSAPKAFHEPLYHFLFRLNEQEATPAISQAVHLITDHLIDLSHAMAFTYQLDGYIYGRYSFEQNFEKAEELVRRCSKDSPHFISGSRDYLVTIPPTPQIVSLIRVISDKLEEINSYDIYKLRGLFFGNSSFPRNLELAKAVLAKFTIENKNVLYEMCMIISADEQTPEHEEALSLISERLFEIGDPEALVRKLNYSLTEEEEEAQDQLSKEDIQKFLSNANTTNPGVIYSIIFNHSQEYGTKPSPQTKKVLIDFLVEQGDFQAIGLKFRSLLFGDNGFEKADPIEALKIYYKTNAKFNLGVGDSVVFEIQERLQKEKMDEAEHQSLLQILDVFLPVNGDFFSKIRNLKKDENGVEKDLEKTNKLIRFAIDIDLPYFQHYKVKALSEGRYGIEQDLVAARMLVEKLFKEGHTAGEHLMVKGLSQGRYGFEKNQEKARMINNSLLPDDPAAERKLKGLAKGMNGYAQNLDEARAFIEEMSRDENLEYLGFRYKVIGLYKGKYGYEKNPAAAKEFIEETLQRKTDMPTLGLKHRGLKEGIYGYDINQEEADKVMLQMQELMSEKVRAMNASINQEQGEANEYFEGPDKCFYGSPEVLLSAVCNVGNDSEQDLEFAANVLYDHSSKMSDAELLYASLFSLGHQQETLDLRRNITTKLKALKVTPEKIDTWFTSLQFNDPIAAYEFAIFMDYLPEDLR